jgi:xanthine dehydrogenase small subunit
MIHFILNNKSVQTDINPGTTLLDFVREIQRLKGTKIGCREGDCGACTVLVGMLNNETVEYKTMTSCLMPMANANGKHIVTIEGLNMLSLSPVQKAMVEHNGTQCGFCTVGFVVSLSSFLLQKNNSLSSAIKAIDGNICRCTGYKSIELAAADISKSVSKKPSHNSIEWLVEKQFIPEYFKTIKSRLESINYQEKLHSINDNNPQIIGGGTDLYVQKHDEITFTQNDFIFDYDRFKKIELKDNQFRIGAVATVSDLLEACPIHEILPGFSNYMKLVSSTPIRNMATLGGNIVNASPIGDMTIFFLALNAQIVLKGINKSRSLHLKDFYLGYKTLEKEQNEMVTEIIFDIPARNYHFNFEKVSKRTHLDIASVNSACLIELNDDGRIANAHISAGGVSAIPKYLESTSAYLIGKTISDAVIKEALEMAQKEISPISDARGSKEYKRFLLRQLMLCHFQKFFSSQLEIKNLLVYEG